MDALLFWLQLSLGMNCPIFCVDELPFFLHGFSFWLHLFYGLMVILAPFFFNGYCDFGSIFFINDHQFGYITNLKKQNIGYIGESRGSFVSIL
jgi:hypothetical protein